MPLVLLENDITKMPVDAIVNAANQRLAPGSGVCGAIFAAAGYEQLEQACQMIGGCPTGQAVITDGFQLQAKHVIHTVGPIWYGGSRGEEELLRGCYRHSLELAKEYGCTSIAFPLVSAGIYGYPKRQALHIAVSSILNFLEQNDMQVYLTLFGSELVKLASEMYPELTI